MSAVFRSLCASRWFAAGLVVTALLIEDCADPLDNAAAHLLVDQQRVDDAAAVIDRPIPQDPNKAGRDVDLDRAACAPFAMYGGVVVDLGAACRQLDDEVLRSSSRCAASGARCE